MTEPRSTGVEAVASLPDRIAQAITEACLSGEKAIGYGDHPSKAGRQVLRAAEIDRAELKRAVSMGWAAGQRLTVPGSAEQAAVILRGIAARYGVSLDG